MVVFLVTFCAVDLIVLITVAVIRLFTSLCYACVAAGATATAILAVALAKVS